MFGHDIVSKSWARVQKGFYLKYLTVHWAMNKCTKHVNVALIEDYKKSFCIKTVKKAFEQ